MAGLIRHMVNEFAKALVEDRDPWPNARTSANWTCVGICARVCGKRRYYRPPSRVYTSVGMDVRLKYFSVPLEAGWQSLEFSDAQLSENSQCLLYRGAVCQNAPLGTAHA